MKNKRGQVCAQICKRLCKCSFCTLFTFSAYTNYLIMATDGYKKLFSCCLLESNRGFLVQEATGLPTVQHPLGIFAAMVY